MIKYFLGILALAAIPYGILWLVKLFMLIFKKKRVLRWLK